MKTPSDSAPPPALVTGANGFVGSHLAEALLRRGAPVRCLVRRTSDLKWLEGLSVETVTGELNDPASLENAVRGTGWVFHLAGRTKGLSRDEFIRDNALGTRNLVEACLRVSPRPARFVYVSSLAAAGPSPDGRPLTEDDPPNPVTWYGESKLLGEKACLEAFPGLAAVVVRPPVVFGPRDTDMLAFFRAVNRGVIPRIGWRSGTAGFVYVEDLVEGLILAAGHPASAGRTYFLADDGNLSVTEFGRIAARAMGRRSFPVAVPLALLHALLAWNEALSRLGRKPGILNLQKWPEFRERFWCCDTRRAESELGFPARRGLDEAVKKTAEWYRGRGWL